MVTKKPLEIDIHSPKCDHTLTAILDTVFCIECIEYFFYLIINTIILIPKGVILN